MEVNREEIQLDCLCATGESLLNRLSSFQLDGLGKKKKKNLKERNGKGGGICLKKKKSAFNFQAPSLADYAAASFLLQFTSLLL